MGATPKRRCLGVHHFGRGQWRGLVLCLPPAGDGHAYFPGTSDRKPRCARDVGYAMVSLVQDVGFAGRLDQRCSVSESDITSQDHRTRHCPMLGHVIGLGYCRAPGVDLPCGRILDCWWEQFDVEAFIQAHYSPE